MAIFLCGFMGCGKTTIGKRLAQKLGRSYCDMDEMIVKKAGMTIPEIFEKLGEPEFRKMETELIKELGSFGGVVSCGGGAMLDPKNGEAAKKSGVVLFLDVPFELCYERIKDDGNRPVAASRTKEQLLELFEERYPKYKAHSGITVECTGTPEIVSTEIISLLRSYGELK